MRALPLPLALAALLVAAPAPAQERAAPLAEDFRSYTVAEDVTLEAPAATVLPAASEMEEAGPEADEEEATRADAPADAPVQEIGSRNWLYLVAAIVAGGIILAVLL